MTDQGKRPRTGDAESDAESARDVPTEPPLNPLASGAATSLPASSGLKELSTSQTVDGPTLLAVVTTTVQDAIAKNNEDLQSRILAAVL